MKPDFQSSLDLLSLNIRTWASYNARPSATQLMHATVSGWPGMVAVRKELEDAAKWQELADEAIRDAGEWKMRARTAEALNTDLVAALNSLLSSVRSGKKTAKLNFAFELARAAIVKATKVHS